MNKTTQNKTPLSVELANDRAIVFKSIYGVEKFVDILDLFKAKYITVKDDDIKGIQSLYREFSYAIFYMYSPSSIRNNLVAFRNVIKKEDGTLQAVALETFTVDAIYAPIQAKDKAVKEELKQNLRDGKAESQNADPKEIINKIKELKEIVDSESYLEGMTNRQKPEQVRSYYLLALLGLATGRRATELLKTLVLSKRGEKHYFEGLLKGNDHKIGANIIGLSYKETQGYLRQLRRIINTKELTEKQVNAKYSRVLNNAIKRIMGYKNVKDLRHNYAIAGSQLFKRDNETIEDTISRILGHKETFTSSLNYA